MLTMTHATHFSQSTQQLTVEVRRFGQTFPFRLCTRPLRLGTHATIQYYWADISQLRALSSEAGAANYRNCLTHWWGSMQARELNQDLDQQIHYVMAQVYPLVSRSRTLQDVYRDAFLQPRRLKDAVASLPDEDRKRIDEIACSRDRARVKQELDAVLGRFVPPSKMLPALQEAFRNWVGRGVTLWRRHGPLGLKHFLGEVDYWLDKYRKKGGHRWVRHFINLFAYEAKVSFFTCFSNVWIDLIPCLRERQGLDVVSERFLRTWHCQNQPVEIAHGRTASGIYYPTHIRYQFLLPGPGGSVVQRQLCFPTERVGPTHLPDVFSGQILSLHPLSGFFMGDPALCDVAGRFFASDRYEENRANGLAEYWKFVGAILTAASLYRCAADDQANSRGVHLQKGDALAAAAAAPDEITEAQLLEDFAEARKVTCPDCGGPLSFLKYYPAGDSDPVRIDYTCRSCQRLVVDITSTACLLDWLRPAN
jgi:hypothetical protein